MQKWDKSLEGITRLKDGAIVPRERYFTTDITVRENNMTRIDSRRDRLLITSYCSKGFRLSDRFANVSLRKLTFSIDYALFDGFPFDRFISSWKFQRDRKLFSVRLSLSLSLCPTF